MASASATNKGNMKKIKPNARSIVGKTRCMLQWIESSLKAPGKAEPLTIPKPIFRMMVEFSIRESMVVLYVQNLCPQVLILREIYLYYEKHMRVSLFDGVLRMVPGYEYVIEREIHEKEDRSYHVVLLCQVIGTKFKLRETVLIHLLSPRIPRGLPMAMKKLPMFEIPDYVQDVYKNDFLAIQHYNRNSTLWLERFKKYRSEKLNSKNYVEYLRMLNQIDELHRDHQMQRYTIESANLKETLPNEYMLSIEQFNVPPVLLDVGSHVHVYSEANKSILTRGMIIDRSSCFIIKTDVPLRKLRSLRLVFPLNRTQYIMEHMALNYVCHLDLNSVLFPEPQAEKSTKAIKKAFKEEHITKFKWFQDCIATNEQQKQAIKNIINRTAYPAPYILFGPPGTGKTCTIVEAVLQIWKLRKKSRILLTATSNFACNELTKRLLKYVPRTDIFRYFSLTTERDIHEIDLKVIEVSNMHYGEYETPSAEDFTHTRILVCTVMISARLLQLNVGRSMYDYIFIDECGSCKELSALVPIACVGTDTAKGKLHASVVLAGDPKQLGPVTLMPYLRGTPHDVSLLERLMNLPLYQKDLNNNDYNPDMVTKLLDNYRSHGALFQFSNQQFYDGELRAKGSPAIINWAVKWQQLPNRDFPMIFHTVIGYMQQDSITLSYWNAQEATKVYEYVQLLLKEEINGRMLQQEDIGIVTPYSKQVEFIKNGLTVLGLDSIEVGSVDQFQGREKPVIIISTVRSNRTSVGFLADVRRLNVALTRAQALTIIIGNAKILMKNRTWYEFLKLLKANKAIAGKMFYCDKTFSTRKMMDEVELANGWNFA